MKKRFLILSLITLSVFLSGCGNKKTSQKENNPVPTETPNVLPEKPIEESIKERPFVSLISTADGHWVDLKITNFKGTTGVEYDLIYLADVEGNRIERGVSTGGKAVDLNGQSEFLKKILFGSSSCTTGVCKYKYDENVNEGTLTLTFTMPSGKQKYESTFRIQSGKEAKDGLSTGDGKFILTSSGLSNSSLYLTISSIGVPKPLEKTVKSIPYAVYSNGNIKSGTVKIKTTSETGFIYGYDGKVWKQLETTIIGGEAKANFLSQYIFILAE